MKTLRKLDLDSMERELQVLGNLEKILGGAKGDWDHPYTQGEYDAMVANGSWTNGGYVEGIGNSGETGYALPEVTISGSATSCKDSMFNGTTCTSFYDHLAALNYASNRIRAYSATADVLTYVGVTIAATNVGVGIGMLSVNATTQRILWEQTYSQLQQSSNMGLQVIQNFNDGMYSETPLVYQMHP